MPAERFFVTSCPPALPLVTQAACGTSCAEGLFIRAFGYALCISSCPFPYALVPSNTYVAGYHQCAPQCSDALGPGAWFMTRAQECVSSCSYRNSTQAGICEIPEDAANCPAF